MLESTPGPLRALRLRFCAFVPTVTRNRRRKQSRARSPGPGSPQRAGERAGVALGAGRYKDAIADFKALLKGGEREEWRQGLADAYQGRARALAEKGMFREAAVIWEQRAATCSGELVQTEYLGALLGSGQARRAAALAHQHRERLRSTPAGWDADAWLAAAALCGAAEVLEELPADDPVVRDFAVADAALAAYCRADDARLDEELGRIAFRSPYRDLRTALKACRVLAVDPAEASALVRRIAPDSPFRGLVHIVERAARPVDELVESLRGADTNTRNTVHALLGLDGAEVRFVQAASRLDAAPKPKALLELVLRHADVIGSDSARRLAGALIAHHPQGIKAYGKVFGSPPPFESSRWLALATELAGDADELDDAWRDALSELDEGLDEEDNRIRTTLILRRLVENTARHWGRDHPSIVDDLELIVALDPADRESWLQLIDTAREGNDLKTARAHLNGALKQFPGDPAMLVAAVETAIASNAFKKAAHFAARLVEVDPLNPRAKRLLLAAHLEHGRKQIRASKFAAARKELDQAAGWVGTESDRGEIALLRGMVALSEGSGDAAGPLLREGLSAIGGGWTGRFFLHLEAFRLRCGVGAALTAAGLSGRVADPAPAEVVKLMRAIQGLDASHDEGIRAALGEMAGPLGRAARGKARAGYTMADLELVCEALKRRAEHGLLEKYARAALHVFKEQPVFVYFLTHAKGDGAMFGLGPREIERLERALERAREAGDQRTVHRIVTLLESGFVPFPPRMPLPPGPRGIPGVGMHEGFDPFAAGGFEEPDDLDASAIFKLIELLGDDDEAVDAIERLFGKRGGRANRGRRKRTPRRAGPQGELFE